MRFFLKASSAKAFALLLALSIIISYQSKAQNCQSNNYAANQPVVASEGSDIAANIVDGNLSTEWFSASDGGKWIYVDLGQSRSLCTVRLKWGHWGNIPQTLVQGSNTANNDWVDLYTIPASDHGIPAADNSYDYADVDLSATTTAYRYVRLYYASGASWGPHLKELEVYIQSPVLSPTVSITSPGSGANYIEGSSISFTATAAEQGGSISKVEYYQGTTKIGEATASPYQFTWQNVEEGEYSITAKAWDANNNSSASGSIPIYVDVPYPAWSLTGNTATTSGNFIGTADNNPLIFKTNNVEGFRLTADGKIGINTAVVPTGASLAVNGEIWARKLKITQATWADYVFSKNYKLRSLKELEKYVRVHHHLPDIPTSGFVRQEGIDVGTNEAVLLQKIEELTLYIIDQDKRIKSLEVQNKNLLEVKTELNEIRQKLNQVKK